VVLESEMQSFVTEVLRLGFGKCSLQVQVPEASPIKTPEDLAGKRVVSSFQVLSTDYFNKVDDRLQLTGEQRTKIEYVGGSVEAACSLGLADGIGKCRFNICQQDLLTFTMDSVDLVGTLGLIVCLTFLSDPCFQNPGKQCVLPVCTLSQMFWKRKPY
jgi:hypothetical protein